MTHTRIIEQKKHHLIQGGPRIQLEVGLVITLVIGVK